MQYNDGNTEVVSMWVCRSLEDRKAQQAQILMWTTVAQDGIMGDGVHISLIYSSTEPRRAAAELAALPPMLEFNGARWDNCYESYADYARIMHKRILTVCKGLHWCSKSLTLFFCSGFLFTFCADSKVNVFTEDPCGGLLLTRLESSKKWCLCLYLKPQSGFAKTLWACHKSSRVQWNITVFKYMGVCQASLRAAVQVMLLLF